MPMLRWLGRSLEISLPSMTMAPAVGISKPAIMRSVVVLPQPLGPRKETNSPCATSSVKSSTAALWALGNSFANVGQFQKGHRIP